MKKTILSLLLVLCIACIAEAQTTYYYRGGAGTAAAGTAWTTATNWTKNSDGTADGTGGRATALSNDVLIIDGNILQTLNTSKTCYLSMAKDACGSLSIINGAIVYITSVTGGTSDVVAAAGTYTIGSTATGTVAFPVTGVGTTFTTSLRPGDYLSTTGSTTSIGQVLSIVDDQNMTVTNDYSLTTGTVLYRIPTLTINNSFTLDATSVLHMGFTTSAGSLILFNLYLASTATGSISGQVFFQRNGCQARIIAVTPGSLVFQNGSICTIQANPATIATTMTAGPFFGTALGTGLAGGSPQFAFNSNAAGVTFASGSTYIVNFAGRLYTPFGRATQATTPLSYSGAVAFQSGSNYTITSVTTFYNGLPYFYNSLNATYGNVNLNCAGLPNNGASPAAVNLTLGRVDNLTIGSTMTTAYTASNTTGNINLYGNIVSNSSVAVNYGNVNVMGSVPQSISGSGAPTFNNLTINNASGFSLAHATATTTTVNGVLNYTNGTISTGVNTLALGASASALIGASGTLSVDAGGTVNLNARPVTIQSTLSGTGRISAVLGTLSNATNVTTELYVPAGRRAYRFIGHPFSSTLDMSSLLDDIYVTGDGTTAGSGGTTTGTGLDATATNAASAWWFDNSNNTWKAFTSSTDASWTPYSAIRVFVRGNRYQPESLTGATYSPNADTIDVTGVLNIGAQNISAPTANNYHLLSNPYPSPTDIGTVIGATANIGTQYWVWDPRAATRGAYVTKSTSGGAYSIPMNGAFMVQPTAGTTLAFTETNKTSTASTGNNYFRGGANNSIVELQLLYNGYPADNFILNLNKNASPTTEKADGIKFMNNDMNIYAITTDGKKLSLDSRPMDENDKVTLVVQTNVKTTYQLKVLQYNTDKTLYLKDNFTNELTPLTSNTLYSFDVNDNAASQGVGRFEIISKQNPVLTPVTTKLSVKISPNPVKDILTISYNQPEATEAHIRISNAQGVTVQTIVLPVASSGTQKINMSKFASGAYTVELINGNERISQQVIKF